METSSACTTKEPAQETIQQVKRLLADLQSSERKRRKAAEAALHAMGDDAVRSIVALKHMGMRGPEARVHRRHALVLLCAAAGLICSGFMLISLQKGSMLGALLSVIVCPFLGLIAWKAERWSSPVTAPTRSELLLLLSLSDRRSIPVLMDLQSNIADRYQQWQIRKRIVELLPTLDVADAQMMPHTYISRLARSIEGACAWQEGSDVRFAVAVIKALEKIGTHDGVRVVEKLAQSAQHEEIRQAAHACLPHLLISAERQQVSGTLLRAASQAEPRAELVRAATSVDDGGASQLLRVADGEPPR